MPPANAERKTRCSVRKAMKLQADSSLACRPLPMNRDSQTRMTNDEIRRNDKIRMTKPATAQLRAFGHSGFGFLSSFEIRHSSFNDLCNSGSWSQCMREAKEAFP